MLGRRTRPAAQLTHGLQGSADGYSAGLRPASTVQLSFLLPLGEMAQSQVELPVLNDWIFLRSVDRKQQRRAARSAWRSSGADGRGFRRVRLHICCARFFDGEDAAATLH
jgi:hypothetical protein